MSIQQPYREYKITGNAWCVRVPKHWEFVPVRRIGRVLSGGTPPGSATNWGGDIPFVTPPDLRPVIGDAVRETARSVTEEGVLGGSTVAPAGSVLTSIRAPIGYVARTEKPMAFNQGCRALVPSSGHVVRYVTYTMLAAKSELEAQGRGTTFMEVSSAQFSNLSLPLPPQHEQRIIADYLDRETARIDLLTAKQQYLIQTLHERRAAIRDQHFATMERKRQTSVRRVLMPLSRPAAPGLGVITAFRDGVVTLRSNRRDDGYTFSDTEHGYQEVHPGDLVFHALDGFAGAVGISDSHGNATPVYHVCRVITDDVPEYVAMLLRHLGVSGFLATQAPNVRQRSVDFRNWDMFARIPLALPPVGEQRAFLADISAQTAKIDLLIAKAQRFIQLVTERRAALVTAAVTGQIDVRTASTDSAA